ncbi:MAG: FKBP-type peptidyl-prolyl cis-trans isomerase [Mariprofundaceae bacterium]|nr:FKBP-type peptidyl-prolyl cis-trans isomerase [Mariprofundaceae bacterium]
MKKYIAMTAAVVVMAGCSAGTQQANEKKNKLSLDNESSKFSYAIGLDVGKSLKSIGTGLDLDAFDAAVASVIKGEKPMLSSKEVAAAKQSVFKAQRDKLLARQKDLGLKNKAEGEKFLAENAKKEGVQTMASGLQYQIIKSGDGVKPKATDTVKVNYEGQLIDGTVFDSSYKRGQPVTFPLKQVIKGWTEGLQLMPVGSKYRLFLSSELAYGAHGAGSRIGPNATLIFDVELLSIEK